MTTQSLRISAQRLKDWADIQLARIADPANALDSFLILQFVGDVVDLSTNYFDEHLRDDNDSPFNNEWLESIGFTRGTDARGNPRMHWREPTGGPPFLAAWVFADNSVTWQIGIRQADVPCEIRPRTRGEVRRLLTRVLADLADPLRRAY